MGQVHKTPSNCYSNELGQDKDVNEESYVFIGQYYT